MNMQKTGTFIQTSRRCLNLSQQALGKYLSVTDKAVSKWERGLACPDIENLKNMAILFHCSISDIIDGTQYDPSHSSNLLMDFPVESSVAKVPEADVTVMICALEEDVTSTCKHCAVTTTLLNRSFDQPKKFTLQHCGAMLSAQLYSAEDVVPGTVFEMSELSVIQKNGIITAVLPPHSIAVICTDVPPGR